MYVTHDQEEALAISDRIAVINKGVIQQLGRPHDIYARPSNQFVATFIGYSNLFKGKIKIENGNKYVIFKNGYKVLMNNLSDEAKDEQEIIIAVRPEEFSISDEGIKAKVKTSTFLGKYNNYEITVGEDEIVPDMPALEFSQDIGHAAVIYNVGDELTLKPNSEKINIFTKDGAKSLIKGVEVYAE